VARGSEVGRELLERLREGLKGDSREACLEAVRDVGRLGAHLDETEARSAAVLLRKAFAGQEDPETRRLMIRALARLKSTHAWVQVLLTSQSDRDPAVQRAARIELLGGGSDFLEVAARLLEEEKSEAFRGEILLVLGDRRRYDAVPLLIGALADRSGIVAGAAAEALEAITGEALGYDAARWKRWHATWLAERPKETGPSVAPAAPGEEPEHRPVRGLAPRFYGLPLTAKDLVFVVDVSGSVGSGGIERAKQELADAVDRLPSDVRVAALFFSESVSTWREGAFEPATPANKEDLRKFLRGIAPGKRTDVFTPLNAGLALVERRVREKHEAGEAFLTPVAMVVVSDGEGNVQATPPRVVADRLDRLDPARTVVHAVVLGSKDNALMAQLAHMGGGHYLRASRD